MYGKISLCSHCVKLRSVENCVFSSLLLFMIPFLPEPCVVFRVSVSPNCPLIEAGEVYRALNTLVGPISSLQ